MIPASGGAARIFSSELDRWVNSFLFSADGEWIYFLYEHEGGTNVARVRPRDGKLERVFDGRSHVIAFDVARSGAITARAEGGNDAPELHAVGKGRSNRLTHVNDAFLDTVKRGSKERVSFKSPDGTMVQAFVTRPPDFDPTRRYPTILHIHGGPVSQFAWGYDFRPQFFAANGYVVVEPNPRGSTGRDQALCARSTRPGASRTMTTSWRRSIT